MTTFEIDFEEQLKSMIIEVTVAIASWEVIRNELGAQATDGEVAQHFCDEWFTA